MIKKTSNNSISSLDDAVNAYKKLPRVLKVVDKSDAFDYLNNHTDGVVGHNHIFYNTDDAMYVIYYVLSDSAKFKILEIREVA